jgi:sodium/bile acid cotransporter 7
MGPNLAVFIIFFLSGMMLDAKSIRSGVGDIKGTLLALAIIFLVSPLLAALCSLLPLKTGFLLGIFIVAVMPTTLSSGVVMTGAAGGNMAHALLITILASFIAIVTIPLALAALLALSGQDAAAAVQIDQGAIMVKLLVVVLLPLILGLMVKLADIKIIARHAKRFNIVNQCMILAIVWMALSPVRDKILDNALMIGQVGIWAVLFHGGLWLAGGLMVHGFHISPGRRESIIFMGGQKTLPLSIIIQMSLFPQYELALVACVMHHIIHLLMDGYLVGRLAAAHDPHHDSFPSRTVGEG